MGRNTDLAFLHPELRLRIQDLLETLQQESIPFQLFEGFRTPERQAELFSRGRTERGDIVTDATAWQSYHQYGAAADFVLNIDGQWSWSTEKGLKAHWKRLHELGRKVGLEPLSWEWPHLQLANVSLADLRAGQYPEGGDEQWSMNLNAAIKSWRGRPAAPPLSRIGPAGESGPATPGSGDAVTAFRVIARGGLRIRSGPGTSFDVINIMPNGAIVQVLQSKDDWALIDAQADGMADGYCHRGFLEAVA